MPCGAPRGRAAGGAQLTGGRCAVGDGAAPVVSACSWLQPGVDLACGRVAPAAASHAVFPGQLPLVPSHPHGDVPYILPPCSLPPFHLASILVPLVLHRSTDPPTLHSTPSLPPALHPTLPSLPSSAL